MFITLSIKHSPNLRVVGQDLGAWQSVLGEFWGLRVTGMIKIENDSDRNGSKCSLGCQ